MNIKLLRASVNDAKELHAMQIESFRELLEKYQDFDTSPGNESVERVEARLKQDFTYYYFICVGARKAGAIRIVDKKEARCLATHPQFMIFDEIAASLDNQTAMEVENSILALRNVGVLMITHRIYEENMRQYDEILVLKDGVISEQGSWDELINKRGDFYELADLLP